MTDDDRLDRLFEKVKDEPPPGLEARLLAAARDPAAARRFDDADLADAARAALGPTLALLALGLALAGGALVWPRPRPARPSPPAPATEPAPPDRGAAPAVDPLPSPAELAFAGPLEPTGRYWPLELE